MKDTANNIVKQSIKFRALLYLAAPVCVILFVVVGYQWFTENIAYDKTDKSFAVNLHVMKYSCDLEADLQAVYEECFSTTFKNKYSSKQLEEFIEKYPYVLSDFYKRIDNYQAISVFSSNTSLVALYDPLFGYRAAVRLWYYEAPASKRIPSYHVEVLLSSKLSEPNPERSYLDRVRIEGLRVTDYKNHAETNLVTIE